MKGKSTQYSLADPFVGINPPPPEVLKESHLDQPTEAEQPHIWNGHRRKKRGGVAPARGEKLSQSAAGPVVPSPPGTFPKLEAGNPTRPVPNPQVSQRLQHLHRS